LIEQEMEGIGSDGNGAERNGAERLFMNFQTKEKKNA